MRRSLSSQLAVVAGLCCVAGAQAATLQVALQAATQNATSPLLDQLIAKVERNYAGYVLEVAPDDARRAAYAEFVADRHVSIVGVRHGEHVYGLGYPVIAASDRLPEGGLNRTGIAPDVLIGPEVVDPIAFVREHDQR